MSEIDKIQLKDASGQLIAEYDLPGGSSSDEKVKQIPTSTGDTAYEVLFSGGANNTEETDYARKTNALRYLPSNEGLYFGYTSNQDIGVEIIGTNGELRARQGPSDYTIINSLNDINIKLYSNSNVLTITETDILAGGTNNSWDGTNASLKNAIRSKMSPSESATLRIGQKASPTSNSRLSKIIFKMPVTDDNIEKPIMLEISAYNSTSTTSLNEGYDVIEIVFGYDSTNSTTYVKKFECAHSYYYLYKNQTVTEEGVDYDIWYLIYEFVTGIDTFELHRIYGAGYEYVKFYTTWMSDLPPTAIPATSLRYVAKAGDTMTGQLVGKRAGTSWIAGRDGASFVNDSSSDIAGFRPITSVKSNNGTWEMGTLNGSEDLYFSYASDTKYYAGTNQTGRYKISKHSENGDYTIAHSGNVGTGDSNGQVKIAGTNVSVKGLGNAAYDNTVSIAHGGTGATTRINAFKALANNGIGTNATHFVTFKHDWSYAGFSSASDVRGILNISDGSSGNWFNGRVPSLSSNGVIEVGKYMDFHTANTQTNDFTFRFTNTENAKLTASGTITQGSSRKIKENIKSISDEEALKILELDPVSFDYIEYYGGDKDHRGFIAEDVAEILPNLVTKEYGDEKDLKHFTPMSLSYNEMIPYLVKVIQIQEKRISELESKLN